MESSQAGIIINNSNTIVLSVNLAVKYAIGIASGGGIIGIFVSLLGKVGDAWIKDFFEKRKQSRVKKQEAARDITSFCIEGMHTAFKHKAGSEHHIEFRAAEIESIDENVGIKLRDFLGTWSMYRNFIKDKPVDVQTEELAITYRNKAQKLGEELLAIAREWAK